MNQFINALSMLEPILCAAALFAIFFSRQSRTYRYLAGFLAVRLLSLGLLITLLHPKELGVTARMAYDCYFWIYWLSYALEALCGFGIVLSIFKLAMEPFKGLQSLGMIVFRWAGAISIAIAVTIGFGPHITTNQFIIRAVSQLQQTQSVLTLCMVLFVCFAIHPMGLSYRSRVFGVSLGLGLLAMMDLVQTAWLSQTTKIDSMFTSVNSVTICLTLAIWGVYFAMPEPERRMILLPTTSPFFRWNQISEVLGDEPGYVAVGEVTLDMFAPAELEVMRRASGKMHNAMTA